MPPEIFPAAADIARETESLQFPHFDEAEAFALGKRLRAMAQAQNLGVVINIRTNNRCLFHAAVAGSAALNDLWAQRKSNTALLFGKSSLEVGCINRERGTDLTRHGLDPAQYADAGGAVPVLVAGAQMVAVVTVSGLPQLEDHALVIAAMRAHLA